MVALYRELPEELVSQLLLRQQGYFFRDNNPLRETRVATPVFYWVLCQKRRPSYLTGFGDGIDALLIFSSYEKAVTCLKNLGKRLRNYRALRFSWDKLVEYFKDSYRFVALDDLASDEHLTFPLVALRPQE